MEKKKDPEKQNIVRVSYKIRRITERCFSLGVTMTNRRLTRPHIGGGEFRLLASFETNTELARWVKKHPAPKAFVGGYWECDVKADEHKDFYYGELAERIFFGKPGWCASSRARIYKAKKQKLWRQEVEAAQKEARERQLFYARPCRCGHDGEWHDSDNNKNRMHCQRYNCDCKKYKPVGRKP